VLRVPVRVDWLSMRGEFIVMPAAQSAVRCTSTGCGKLQAITIRVHINANGAHSVAL
jgi:hypothetical protein